MTRITNAVKEAIRADENIVTDYVHPHSLNSGIPSDSIPPPKIGGEFLVDDAVREGRGLFFTV